MKAVWMCLAMLVGSAGAAAPGPGSEEYWMWGHHPDSFDVAAAKGENYNFPKGRRIDMADACRSLGVGKCCVVRWRGLPAYPYDDYARQFTNLDEIAWSITDSGQETHVWKQEEALRLAKRHKNLTTFFLDDFFCGEDWKLLPPENLLKFKARARQINPKSRLACVLYADWNGVKPEFKPTLDVCDVVSFWFWEGKSLPTMRAKVEELRKLIGSEKKVLLGIYLWDFGGKKPLTRAETAAQLATAEWLLDRKLVNGLIFHCTPLVDLNLDSVDCARSWLKDRKLNVAERGDDGAQVLFGSTRYGTLTRAESLPKACRAVETVRGESPSLLPDGHEFKLVWHDEFNGTQLDTSKWGYRTNFWGRRFEAFAAPEDGCVEVKDGKVHLKLKKRADGHFCSPQLQTGELMWDYPLEKNPSGFWPLPKRQPAKFTHRYGYYESRFRMQRRPGWWSAFWMQSETQGCNLDPARSGIEHDIMESFYPGCVGRHMFHMNGYGKDYRGYCIPLDGAGNKTRKDYTLDLDVEEYHTFGLLWEPDGYTVFVDGRRDGEKVGLAQGKPVSRVPEFILISTECQWYRNNRMTGKAVPILEESAHLGDDFVVDYVRVYDIVK